MKKKRIATGIIAVGVSIGSLITGNIPTLMGSQVVHASGCFDGDRYGAAHIPNGRFIDGPAPVWFQWDDTAGGYHLGKIELRYAPGFRCAWGLVSNVGWGMTTWVDRSYDGGRTWQGLLGKRSVHFGYSSTYTGLYNDAGLLMRACAASDTGTYCTNWY